MAMATKGPELTDLERAVLERLLRGDHLILKALRTQLQSAEVTSREFTGVGFFTDFKVPRSVPPAPTARSHLAITGVHAKIPGLERPVGFVLFVEDGYLACLEGFTYDEPWPSVITAFSLEDDWVRPELDEELADDCNDSES